MPDKFSIKLNNSELIEYWVEQWSVVYRHMIGLIASHPQNCFPFCYESFCQSPNEVWSSLVRLLDLGADTRLAEPIIQRARPQVAAKDAMQVEALDIYEHLDELFSLTFLT